MILKKAGIKKFRLLKDITLNFDENTTLIVGRNNSGKTSFAEVFNIFMNKSNFEFEDFSLACHSEFKTVYEKFKKIDENNKEEVIREIQNEIPKIELIITLGYSKEESLTNIVPFLTSLEDKNELDIIFQYSIEDKNIEKFLNYIQKLIVVENEIMPLIEMYFKDFYKITISPYSSDRNLKNIESLDKAKIEKLFKCNFIYAQRDVEDSNSTSSNKLSSIFHKQYQKLNEDTNKQKKAFNELEKSVLDINNNIDESLNNFFQEFISSLDEFGFTNLNSSSSNQLAIKSKLQLEKLFKDNVKLFYKNNSSFLPEKYNGLGYSNLIYIISTIKHIHREYKQNVSDLNLIFIEEPESHMHPQMQNLFIQKIDKFLKSHNEFNVQIVITTHSSNLIASSEFHTIKYFNGDNNSTEVKDLMNFKEKEKETVSNFLKQYLTFEKSEMFFADKIILIEGVVERLLLPIFIKKIDEELSENKLSEQYISVIEVGGAYIHIFKELLEFLELKTLIITDIDSIDVANSRRAVEVSKNSNIETSNACLKNWLPKESNISELLSFTEEQKINGKVKVAYQTNVSENSDEIKCGRSFEEAFIIENSEYIFNKAFNFEDNEYKFDKNSFSNITQKNIKKCQNKEEIKNNSYDISNDINSKTDFAFDLLSDNSWSVPTYIKEGLIWLAK